MCSKLRDETQKTVLSLRLGFLFFLSSFIDSDLFFLLLHGDFRLPLRFFSFSIFKVFSLFFLNFVFVLICVYFFLQWYRNMIFESLTGSSSNF